MCNLNTIKKLSWVSSLLGTLLVTQNVAAADTQKLAVEEGDHVVVLGSGLASRMMKYSHFETEMQLRYPEAKLTIRNIADEGNTPVFRPHPGRELQLAFEGAEALYPKHESGKSGPWTKGAVGFFETPDEWLTRLEADTIIAFFGFNSAFKGEAYLPAFRAELEAFIDHTLAQSYNGKTAPQLALVSPTAIQDLSALYDTPDGKEANQNLALYTQEMANVCQGKGVAFLDLYTPSLEKFATTKPLTVDGALLNDEGYQWLATYLADGLYGEKPSASPHYELVHAAVKEKNWMWHHLYKIPNGVHVYGRRHKPYGPENYPFELLKLDDMVKVRDQAVWAALDGVVSNLYEADRKTYELPEVPTNYKPSKKNGEMRYLSGKETTAKLNVPEGYKIELFADESMFPELANPSQMSFDNQGRLWVGCMPSYPHWKPGDAKPTDKIIILEDTDNDGVADKCTTFADDLHLCIGFEIATEGVYVSQADSLVLLTDTDGDDRYDEKTYLLSGFDDHDTHHAISAFSTDPSGAIYLGEGVFLHSNVESVYGTHRGTNGGFFRYNPTRRKLERYAQLNIPNPWGISFDQWGQGFFLHSSDPKVNWLSPGAIKPVYGSAMDASRDLLTSNKVRPCTGLEMMSSRHFPEEVQGDLMLGNAIGFLGVKQHQLLDDGTGYTTQFRHDMLKSDEGNFRPGDLEIAPDGSLYVIDWSNVLIGHMQHSARDPHRDHEHGRVYRITYPSRPLVKPANIHGAPLTTLFENLKLHEDRSRYRTRRELRGRDSAEVLDGLKAWVSGLDKTDIKYERYLLEALWVSWGHNEIDQPLLKRLLASSDYRVRAAAVKAVKFNTHQVSDYLEIFKTAAQDAHGRVRVEVISAASRLSQAEGVELLGMVKNKGLDDWMTDSYRFAEASLNDAQVKEQEAKVKIPKQLKGNKQAAKLFTLGHEVFHRDAHCATCHQDDGKGLPSSNLPPIAGTKWVNESKERLIKITLNGLMGPIEVQGKQYQSAMTQFKGMLTDEEVAGVLTYIKNSFGNNSGYIDEALVKTVRAELKGNNVMFTSEQLLEQHPHE